MQLLTGLRGRAEFLAFAPDSQTLFSAGPYSPAVYQWNLGESISAESPSGRHIRRVFQPQELRSGVSQMVLAPNGSRLMVGYNLSNRWVWWNVLTGQQLILTKMPFTPPDTSSLACSPDGRFVFLIFGVGRPGAHASGVMRWEFLSTGSIPEALSIENIAGARKPAISTDGQTLALLFPGVPAVRRFTLPQGQEQPTPCFQAEFDHAWFSPDLDTLASVRTTGFLVGKTSTVTLWDVATGMARATISSERKEFTDLAFSPDGRTLATAGADGTVRLWDVKTGRERTAFNWDIGKLYSVAFAPDGMLAAAGGKSEIIVWDLDT